MSRLQGFLERVISRQTVVGVLGLGYVGLPLAILYSRKGFRVVGLDVDARKIEMLRAGRTYIRHICAKSVAEAVANGLEPTTDLSRVKDCDVVLVCVPTPLNRHREPDMTHVVCSCEAIAANLHPGQLVVLESSTYPGTTDELMRPILERTGLVAHRDFFVAYSPERQDPNNADFTTETIPKVVGADSPESLAAAVAVYQAAIDHVVPVSSSRAAEATKILENTFRAVNIALVNELKCVFERMDIDIWEVIDAAATKPFGFMRFTPGPGLGGHCIPIDPFYLAWKAREVGIKARLIETAGEVNTAMPERILQRTIEALSERGKGLTGARILLLGLAYKKNMDDERESPAYRLMELFEMSGVSVAYHDPFVPVIPVTREHARFAGRTSTPISEAGGFDAIVIVTDHDGMDWDMLLRDARLIVDTRGVFRAPHEKVVKA